MDVAYRACVGIATKFLHAHIALYREKDRDIHFMALCMSLKMASEKNWMFLAYFFVVFFGMIGGLPAVQSNQIVQIIRELSFS